MLIGGHHHRIASGSSSSHQIQIVAVIGSVFVSAPEVPRYETIERMRWDFRGLANQLNLEFGWGAARTASKAAPLRAVNYWEFARQSICRWMRDAPPQRTTAHATIHLSDVLDNRATTRASVSASIGFATCQSYPSAIALSRSVALAYAVTAAAGVRRTCC